MEKELQEENGFNQMDTIDMNIDIDMDEDDFGDFGGKEQAKILKPQVPQSKQVTDKNSAPTVISADVDDFGNLQIKNNKHNMTGIEMVDNEPQHFSGYNQIDMVRFFYVICSCIFWNLVFLDFGISIIK